MTQAHLNKTGGIDVKALSTYLVSAGIAGVSANADAEIIKILYDDPMVMTGPNMSDEGPYCGAEYGGFPDSDCYNILINLLPSEEFGQAEVTQDHAFHPFTLSLYPPNMKDGESFPGGWWKAGEGVNFSWALKSNTIGPGVTWFGNGGDFAITALFLASMRMDGEDIPLRIKGEDLISGFRISASEDFENFYYGWIRYSISPEKKLTLHELRFNTDLNQPLSKPVPAPATLGLLAAGLGGLAAVRRRRQLAA
jgi:hypothetical protein